jgi:hypothetical protein
MLKVSNLHNLPHEYEANGFCTGILNRMSHLNRVWDIKKSEIRFFCDDDARWEKRKNGGWKDEIKYVEGYRLL